jgi:hypothetical protein
MDLDSEDPFTWDVRRVQSWVKENFAFGNELAERFHENDVDGEVLLDGINDSTLKEDLHIKSLGQRVKIIRKIGELKQCTSVLIVSNIQLAISRIDDSHFL